MKRLMIVLFGILLFVGPVMAQPKKPVVIPSTESIPCWQDFNRDGVINEYDINLVAAHWNTRCGNRDYVWAFDLDNDCDIDVVDIMLVAAHWGETCR